MRPFGFRMSGTSEKSGHVVHVAPESLMSLGLQKYATKAAVSSMHCRSHVTALTALSDQRAKCTDRTRCGFCQAMIAAISWTLLACLWTYLHTMAAWPSDGRGMMRVSSSAG
jgi:hypothetical protein